MANNALALRMRYKKLSAEELQAIANDSKSSETEVKIANEFLAKMGVTAEEGVKKVAAKAKRQLKPKRLKRKLLLKRQLRKRLQRKLMQKHRKKAWKRLQRAK